MSYTTAKRIINQMVLDLLTTQGLEDSAQWENTEFNPVGKDLWVTIENEADTPRPTTMGVGGDDRMVGFVTITYAVPTDSGTGVVDDLITGARQALPAGKSFVNGDTKVVITGVGVDVGSTVDSWFTRPLNIYYRTDLTRANV
jgi:hypothetical protein